MFRRRYRRDEWRGWPEPTGVDANGVPTARMWIGEQEVIVHYADIPDSDITTVDGIRCTTALRTVIDLAVELGPDDLGVTIDDALRRELFTVDEAWERLGRPDLATHPGAELVRRVLPYVSG